MSIQITAVLLVCLMFLSGCGKKKETVKEEAQKEASAVVNEGIRKISENDILDLAFFQRDGKWIGYAIGTKDTVLRTGDGGTTWLQVWENKGEKVDFERVTVEAPDRIWIVGGNLLLCHTDVKNVAKEIRKLPGNFYHFGGSTAGLRRYLQLQSPTCGASVYVTADGGETWGTLPAGTPRNDYQAISFSDDKNGCLVGNYGHVAVTSDGGVSWTERNIKEGGNLTQVHMITATTGWAMPMHGHNGGIWKTVDTGKTWTKQDVGLKSYRWIRDMQFIDERTGFILSEGDKGTTVLSVTRDGGAKWSVQGVYGAKFLTLWFAAPEKGWLAGEGGVFIGVGK